MSDVKEKLDRLEFEADSLIDRICLMLAVLVLFAIEGKLWILGLILLLNWFMNFLTFGYLRRRYRIGGS